MHVIDVFLLAIILLAGYSGFKKGFIHGTIDLLSLSLSLVFAFRAFRYVAALFEKYIPSIGAWTLPLSFLTSYIIARSLLSALGGILIRKMPDRVQQNFMNKALGVLPGMVNGLIYAAIISALLTTTPLFDGLSAKPEESYIVKALTPPVEWAEEKLAPVFAEAVNHSIKKVPVDPDSNKTIKLNFSVKYPAERADLEGKMLAMINEERVKIGLPSLKADPEMQAVARAHSRDMFARSYFSHINPEGKASAERAREAGVRFLVAGENLALAQTPEIAHSGLMNSPGHRANILHKAFGRVGIGVLEGGGHGLMITQNFRN